MPEKSWPLLLFNLLVAALAGTLMRLAFVVELPWMDYYNVLHAHSHFALMGWAWLALYSLLHREFVPTYSVHDTFVRLFWALFAAAVGIFLVFLLQGYSLWSISFSTVYLLLAYLFAVKLWPYLPIQRPSGMIARIAVGFMFLSTLSLWSMPILIVNGLRGSAVYYMAVQFFLHFQFNGWLIFGILALGFRLFESWGAVIELSKVRQLLIWLSISCLLTYALAVTWSTPRHWLFVANSLGVIVQAIALGLLWRLGKPLLPLYHAHAFGLPRVLLNIAFLALILKVVIQIAVVLPFIAQVGYTIRNFVIGFIHLILLGFVSTSLLGLSGLRQMWSTTHPIARMAIALFLGGLLGTEGWLFLQGIFYWAAWGFLPATHEILLGLTILFPISIGMLLYVSIKNK